MKRLVLTTLLGSLLIYTPTLMADEQEHHGMGMHGKGMMHGEEHGQHHDDDWHASLSKLQQKQVDKSHLDYLEKVSPVKAKLKAAKVDLALLTIADNPDQDAINKKIDEIVKLKGEKMRLKAAHKIEVRKLLNDEQRMKFDLHVLNKANRGKRGGCH